MTSYLLESMGLYDLDPAYFIIAFAALDLIFLILIIILFAKNAGLKKRYKAFMTGADGKSLEETIKTHLEKFGELEETARKNKRDITLIFRNLESAIQKCGMVKYDAFDEMGGKLSFSLALLDKKDNGIVMNAVHTREGCYTYIKDIINGESVLLLTDEEKGAIDEALGRKTREDTEGQKGEG